MASFGDVTCTTGKIDSTMPRVRVIHWREPEAAPLIEACRRAGFAVDYDAGGATIVSRAIRSNPPDAIVIDLSRLPSHGREVAIWLRKAKPTRYIPLIFVGGETAKVAAIRALLPDAGYCEIANVAEALKRALKTARKAANPVVPAGIMERAREKSAAQKLGIVSGATVAVLDSPRNFPDLLGELPEEVEFGEGHSPLTLWFVHDRESLLVNLRSMRNLAARTKLWLLWRKGSAGYDLTQNFLRESARDVGLVDYKICSVDSLWSAMLFARKKA
jgi:CheY-like chemotaxis protein